MATKRNYDEFSKKKLTTCDNGGAAPWSDLNHDVLGLVMMRLGVVDFPAFSRVCKSWRSFALANKNSFLVSRPPWSIRFSTDASEKECCYLEDFEGRKFKTILPHYASKMCVGLTCGYLILCGRKAHDFWLVNPITRHELHFRHAPVVPYLGDRGVVVFSPSISEWLFAFIKCATHHIWISIVGKGVWNCVSSTFPIFDIVAFKGKIYTINNVLQLCELRLNPKPELTLLKTKNLPMRDIVGMGFVNHDENLYVIQLGSTYLYKVHQLDFGEMKWVCREKIKEEYVFFISHMNQSAAVLRESWWDVTNKNREDGVIMAYMWYFPRESLNVNHID